MTLIKAVKNNKLLVAVMLLTLVFSLSYSFYFHLKPYVDAKDYDRIAWNIAQGYGYQSHLELPIEKDYAIFRVGPGYEYFLALVYFFFGHYYWLIWIIHAILLSASAGLAFLLSRRVLGDRWHYSMGIVAAALVGLSPDLITVSSMLMTETLGIFLVLLFLYLLFLYYEQEKKSPWSAVLLGLLLGLTATVRTPALFFLLPLIVYFIMIKKWRHLLLVILGVALIFSPWIIRNYRVYNYFIPTNLAYGLDLANGNHPGSSGELEIYWENETNLEKYGAIKGSQYITAQAVTYIVTHPLTFIKTTIYRTSIYFSFARPFAFWFHLSGLSKILTIILSSLYAMVIFILGLYGASRLRDWPKADRPRLWLFLSLMVMMPLAIIGIVVETRYRFMIYPFLAVFAGYGFYYLRPDRIKWRPLLIVVAVLGLNTLFDVARNWERIMSMIKGIN